MKMKRKGLYNLLLLCAVLVVALMVLVLEQAHETMAPECKYCINPEDYEVLVAPFDFKVKKREADTVLLIASRNNGDGFQRRMAIRNTWANDTFYLPTKVSHVFVIGECELCFQECLRFGFLIQEVLAPGTPKTCVLEGYSSSLASIVVAKDWENTFWAVVNMLHH